MSVNPHPWPISNILSVKRACTADEPLQPDDSRRVNVESLQYGSGLLELKNALESEPESGYHYRCICGHRGSGKSTEVLGLVRWARQNGYMAVRMVVNDYFGSVAPLSTDLLWMMSVAAEIAATEVNGHLPADAMKSIVRWFGEIVDEDKKEIKSELGLEAAAQIGADGFSLIKLFAKLSTSIKAGSSHAETIRTTLRRRPDALIDLTNNVLTIASGLLRENGYPAGLLVIFDNLDRLDPAEVHTQVFGSCDLIKQAKCHAIFVVPIALAFDPERQISNELDAPIVLPMLALRRHDRAWEATVARSEYDMDAIALMKEVLERRLVLADLFEEVENADLLVRMCGGCLRDLMHLVTRAADVRESGARRLSPAAVERAIINQREDYRRTVPSGGWQLLARIRQASPDIDTDLRNKLLHSRAALSYRAPDGRVWYDAHPLLVETAEFQGAIRGIK